MKWIKRIVLGILAFIGLSALIFVVWVWYLSKDHEPNWHVIEDSRPSESHPYAGFWKADCRDGFGLAIGPLQEDNYYVSFCGPGGCFEKGGYMSNTNIVDDYCYKIVDENKMEIMRGGEFEMYHRCPWE